MSTLVDVVTGVPKRKVSIILYIGATLVTREEAERVRLTSYLKGEPASLDVETPDGSSIYRLGVDDLGNVISSYIGPAP